MIKRRIYTIICSIILILACILSVGAAASPIPVNIERKTIGGTEYIVKTFIVSENIAAEMLVESDFETDGSMFRYTSADRKENISESSRYAVNQATVNTSTNATAAILQQFAPSINYSEDGYFGILTLDTGSLATHPSEYGTRNDPVSKTREYPGLMYNDPSHIPKSISTEGITLALTNIEWIVTGTALAGSALVPVEYKAIASYSGSQNVTYVRSYTATANYTGIVTKKTVDSVNYTITYTGTIIPTAEVTEPPVTTEDTTEPETEQESEPDGSKTPVINYLGFLMIALLLCLIFAGVVGIIYYFKYIRKKKQNKTGISIYNLINDEYILLGIEPLDGSEIIIDLDKFNDSIKSSSFGFVLDKNSAGMLSGNTIAADYNGETLTHIINVTDKTGEYRFKLVFGEKETPQIQIQEENK